MSAFCFESVGDEEATVIWSESPHASVFTNPTVLSRMSSPVEWWVARKGNEPLCLWPVCRPDGSSVGVPGFFYYVGPIWSRLGAQTPAHRWLADSTRVYEGLIRLFIERYGAVHAEFPLGLTDVRVFDWWNYHAPGKPRFEIRPRYTACIRGLQSLTAETLQSGFRELRRRELKRVAATARPVRVADWTTEELVRLHAEVMRSQDPAGRQAIAKDIEALVGIVAAGLGEVIAFRDTDSGELGSVVLLLVDNKAANMVLNLTASRWRRTGMPAWSVYQAVLAAQERGADVFDFNGANSPNRGDDKHSYGASPELFFEIRYPGQRSPAGNDGARQ